MKSNEIPNKLFPFFSCQILWSLHSFNVLNYSNPPLQLDANKNSSSWRSLERPNHDNLVFSFRLFSCKTNFLNSACSWKHQHRALYPLVPTLSFLQLHPVSLIITGSFQAVPGTEQNPFPSLLIFSWCSPRVTSLPVLCSVQSSFLSQMFLNLMPSFSTFTIF